MAIGVSPCPPFVKPPGIPGVIYDGNTAAWFDTSSPQHVVKDGADRVSFLFDKIGYGIGAELVNQATWYTLAYWDIVGINWSQVGNTLVANNAGNIQKNNFWVVGKTYKINISAIVNAGNFVAPCDMGVVSITIAASGNYTYYYTPTLVNMGVVSAGFVGSITALSIKEVTGNHLLQATAASQPLWSANGVLFDGVNDFMKATTFALVQPEFIYFVGRQVTWILARDFFDGDAAGGNFIQGNTGSPKILAYAGIVSADNSNLAVNTFGIIRCLFNGAGSTFRINLTAPDNTNTGANNMGGFTLGSQWNGAIPSNIEVKEILIRRTADNAATQLSIYNYLSNKYAI